MSETEKPFDAEEFTEFLLNFFGHNANGVDLCSDAWIDEDTGILWVKTHGGLTFTINVEQEA